MEEKSVRMQEKRVPKKLKIWSALRHFSDHMVTSVYHIRSQFLTRWGTFHVKWRYNSSPLKSNELMVERLRDKEG